MTERECAAAAPPRREASETQHPTPKRPITLQVNGEAHELFVEPRRLVLDALRDDLDLTGTKRGCEEGVCGCCTVLVDGESIKSCLVLALQARGHEITAAPSVSGSEAVFRVSNLKFPSISDRKSQEIGRKSIGCALV